MAGNTGAYLFNCIIGNGIIQPRYVLWSGNELFYAMLYLLNFTWGPLYLFAPLAVITFPVAVAKTGIALLQVSSTRTSSLKCLHSVRLLTLLLNGTNQ